jgi:FtsP/CotA-like multicopper oxidase with cupredoxin domain
MNPEESNVGTPGRPERTLSRRGLLATGAVVGGSLLAAGRGAARERAALPPEPAGNGEPVRATAPGHGVPPGEPVRDYTPVVVPNGWTLPYRLVDGVKVFHLVAEEVDHEMAPGFVVKCWGYNGGVHGPVIECVQGDRVRIFVTNRLAALTTVHWHGVILPMGMDGVGGLTQRAIRPGETYVYEFTLVQHGTLMYHSHHDEMTQMGMGLTGLVVVHPRASERARPDRDFALLLHEWRVDVGAHRPDPNEMTDFNVLTINAKSFPGTQPLIVKKGDRVRVRIGNLGAMDHHLIHLHGYNFVVTETDGGVIPEAGRWPETGVLVPVGSTRTVEFTADNPGDWALHCHMTHHVMNQMGHHLPNMIGVDARGLDTQVRSLLPHYMTMGQAGMGGMAAMGMALPENSVPMVGGVGPYDEITMGGMFTILKVREGEELANYDEDPGWYRPPPGTRALPANEDVIRANSIDAAGGEVARAPLRARRSWIQPPGGGEES